MNSEIAIDKQYRDWLTDFKQKVRNAQIKAAVNNFALTLPKPQSDLAVQTLKDPYIFDFLEMTTAYVAFGYN